MKLSYQNIGVLVTLFKGVEIIYDSCGCEPEDRCTCEDWVSHIKIGKIVFCVGDNDIEGESCNTYGRLNFTEETTVSDFQKLCAHLGVELVEKKGIVCKHCGQPENNHSSSSMCKTQFTFFTADLEE